MITVFRTSVYFLCLLCCFVASVQAEEEAAATPQAQYHELRPSFVANFGDTTAKRLKFIKADVTVRAYSGEAISAVMEHDAIVRHQIVMILSAQSEASLATSEGQEAIRQTILEKVKAVLKEETGKEQIDDMLFTSFVVQR
jgi:flagellar FliL protein